jgi:hypothetical protein
MKFVSIALIKPSLKAGKHRFRIRFAKEKFVFERFHHIAVAFMYQGVGPRTMNREIAKGVWYTAAISSDLILRYAGAPVTEDDNRRFMVGHFDVHGQRICCYCGENMLVLGMRMMP